MGYFTRRSNTGTASRGRPIRHLQFYNCATSDKLGVIQKWTLLTHDSDLPSYATVHLISLLRPPLTPLFKKDFVKVPSF